ncbi:MAG: FmdB family zinc ribbon protein [Thermoguttaceae bacterium]
MPTYDYQCAACQHTFEQFQSIKDAPLTLCPLCKKKKLHRLISGGAAIVFKGSGFYQTDYRSESYKKGAEASKKHKEQSSQSVQSSESNTNPKSTTESGSSSNSSKTTTTKESSKKGKDR